MPWTETTPIRQLKQAHLTLSPQLLAASPIWSQPPDYPPHHAMVGIIISVSLAWSWRGCRSLSPTIHLPYSSQGSRSARAFFLRFGAPP